MASSNEIPWSRPEQLFLLTEILKDAQIPPDVLLNIITEYKIEPRWNDIPLPPGRSLRACQGAFQALQVSVYGHVIFSPANQHVAATPAAGRKRALTAKDPATPASRALQPRPSGYGAVNGGDTTMANQQAGGDDGAPPAKKKRGRPSRAEIESRMAAAAARGETYPPTKSPRTPKPKAAGADAGHMVTPVSAGAALTATGAVSVGSNMKKRRGRPTKAEAEAKRLVMEAAMAAANDETPAMEEDQQDDGNDEGNDDENDEEAGGVGELTTEAADEPSDGDENENENSIEGGLEDSAVSAAVAQDNTAI